jgi:hypothetical protein
MSFGFLEFCVKFFTQVGQTTIIIIIKLESFFEPEEVSGHETWGKFCRKEKG